MAVEEAPLVKRQKINPEEYVCSATKAFSFKMVQHVSGSASQDIENENAVTVFPPEFCHQLFGEQEEVKGYAGLGVDIWMSLNSFHTWIDIKYTSKRYTAVDLPAIIRQAFPAGYATSKSEFIEQLTAHACTDVFQLGRTVSSRQLPDGSELHVQLHQLATCDPGIKSLHQRLQPLLLFFVDGASAIEDDDPRWDLLLAVRRTNGKDSVVGFSTLYNFFAYPDGTRLRLSQILVLPPFQRLGIGRDMVQAAYTLAIERDVVDLTIEDPSPALQKLRDKMDLAGLMGLSWLRELAEKVVSQASAGAGGSSGNGNGNGTHADGNGPHASNGANNMVVTRTQSPLALSPEAIHRIRKELRLHKSQVKAVWEAMLMQQPGIKTPQGQAAFRELVSARLEALHLPSTADSLPGRIIRDEQQNDLLVFEMFRSKRVRPGPAAASSDGSVCVGRNGVVQIDPEQRAAALNQLLEERMVELQAITSAANRTAA